MVAEATILASTFGTFGRGAQVSAEMIVMGHGSWGTNTYINTLLMLKLENNLETFGQNLQLMALSEVFLGGFVGLYRDCLMVQKSKKPIAMVKMNLQVISSGFLILPFHGASTGGFDKLRPFFL